MGLQWLNSISQVKTLRHNKVRAQMSEGTGARARGHANPAGPRVFPNTKELHSCLLLIGELALASGGRL